MLDEAGAYYASDRIFLELSNEELAILMKLQTMALDYVKRLLDGPVPPALALEKAKERLSNLGYRLEHDEQQPQREAFVDGDCVVFLAHRGNPKAIGPEAITDFKFMRAPSTVAFILKMKHALDNIHEGYRHIWMLYEEPWVKMQPAAPM